MSKILIVDPLTLVGRELLRCLEDAPELALEVEYRHTSADDEVQIAELGGAPAMVPPLDGVDELAHAGVVVVTSDTESERTRHLEELIRSHPEIAVVDVGRLPRLQDLTSPATGATAAAGDRRRLRVAHPALVATATVVAALRPFDPVRGSVAASDPVSAFGRKAIDTLVHQTGRRMQGGEPDHLIGGLVLAFNQVAVDADALTEEAAELLPGFPLAVTRTFTGCFHGHVAHLGIEFAEPVDDPELRDAFDASPDIVVAESQLSLTAVPDRDQVLLAPLQLSPDRRVLALTAMVDGIRLGGAVTAVDIIRALR
jgi:aspartate-semialdehyde dehydrogenase